MSRKNNVNPDHYKNVGRDRPSETVIHDEERKSLARAQGGQDRRKSPLRSRPTRSNGTQASAGAHDDDEQER